MTRKTPSTVSEPPAIPTGRGSGTRDLSTPREREKDRPAPKVTTGDASPKPVPEISIEVVYGSLSRAKADVAIISRYRGLPCAGPGQEFDYLLKSWLSRAIELGMIGSGLGELFLIPQTRIQAEKVVAFDDLLMVGMGDPGCFSADDLRFMMTNVTVGVKALQKESFCCELIGARRNELTIELAGRALLQGVLDGFDRCQGMYDSMNEDERSQFARAFFGDVRIVLVDSEAGKAEAIRQLFEQWAGESALQAKVKLHVSPKVESIGFLKMAGRETSADTAPRDEQLTLLTITCPPSKAKAKAGEADVVVFQYSALSQTATVSMREQEANPYFVSRLPEQMMKARTRAAQEVFGSLWATYLIPEDFHRVIQGSGHLTFVLDETSASYPWEMVAMRGHSDKQFLAIDYQLTRMFRTLLSQVPGMLPPLNRQLKVLVIADPYRDKPLPFARKEAVSVVQAIGLAQQLWGDEYKLRATVRIGSHLDEAGVQETLNEVRKAGVVVESAEPCEPLELLSLILDGEYDVVHYAGHGIFDQANGRMGWVFDKDCVLSAQEIFRVRQVPRLVFANACFSAGMTDASLQPQQRVGLAQAFFARGLQNYIGTGWEVQDDSAAELAGRFYRQVLGVLRQDGKEEAYGKAPPATLGQSLADARRAIMDQGTTWAAYQHYGQANAKLLPFRNVPEK